MPELFMHGYGHDQRPIGLPPVEAIPDGEVAAAIAGYEDARAAAQAARQDVVELELAGRAAAEEKDIAATAAALEAGRAAPAGKAVDAVERRIAQGRRVAGARDEIERRKLDDLRATMRERGAELAELASASQREAEDALGDAFDVLAARMAAVAGARSLTVFAVSGRWKPGASGSMRLPSGQDVGIEVVVGLLRAALLPEPVQAPVVA